MRGNSVITLRPASKAWPPIQASPRAESKVVYGCVDWYLYHDPALAARCAAAAEKVAARGVDLPGGSESLAAA
jgi:hypothetical protein